MEITRDLNPDKEHTHHITNHNRRHSRRSVRSFNTLSSILIQRQIQHYDPDPAHHEHEPRRETFDYVLPVDPTRHEHDGPYRPGDWILGRPDTWRLHNHVVDESGDDEEVGEENQREDCHRRGESEGRELETETRRTEEGEWDETENVEDRID